MIDHERATKDAIRCNCGKLLAVKIPGGIEFKCKRCGDPTRFVIEIESLSIEIENEGQTQ